MDTYYFSELQNRNSFKEAETISAASLPDAQRIALSKQMFVKFSSELTGQEVIAKRQDVTKDNT